MRLDNPNKGKTYDKVLNNEQGEPVYGIRNEGQADEEIVYLPTGKSNHTYYKPEIVMTPVGCAHHFVISDLGKREIECMNCHYATSFNAGVNYLEKDGVGFVTIKGTEYCLH